MAYNKNDEELRKLRQIASSVGVAIGSGGFKYFATGAVSDVQYTVLIPQEDTVFTSFKVDGMEQLSDRNMSGVTFKQGAYLSGGGVITGFTVSSGSVIAYK